MREETEQLMLLYVAGATDDAESARIERMLASGDPGAQAAYAEALAVVHAMPQALPQRTPPKRVRDQLMLRVLASTNASPAPTQASSGGRVWPAWVAGGIAAVLAVTVVLLWQSNERARLELAMQIEEETQTNGIVASPHVKLVKLGSDGATDNEINPSARLMFCPVSGQYQLRVFHMSPPPAGRVYELWLITTDGTKVASGTFVPDQEGSATHYFKATCGTDFEGAAITDEPAGGSVAPTGAIRLSGALTSH